MVRLLYFYNEFEQKLKAGRPICHWTRPAQSFGIHSRCGRLQVKRKRERRTEFVLVLGWKGTELTFEHSNRWNENSVYKSFDDKLTTLIDETAGSEVR